MVSPAVDRVYGLARVCTVWGLPRATLYRRRQSETERPRCRPGPTGPMTDAELALAIRERLAESAFHGEGDRKIWACLRFKGIRTAKRRVLRPTRAHGLQAPHRLGRPISVGQPGPRAHDGTIRTERVDEMPPHAIRIARGPRPWGTDLTSTLTGEGRAAVFILVDHCSGECLGSQRAQQRRAPSAKRTLSGDSGGPPGGPLASRPWSRSARPCATASAASARASPPAPSCATIPPGPAGPVSCRDRIEGLLAFDGSQFVSDDFQAEIAFLGLESSPAFVREPRLRGLLAASPPEIG